MSALRRAGVYLLAVFAVSTLVDASQILRAKDIVLTLEHNDGPVLEQFKLGSGSSPIAQELVLGEGRSLKVTFTVVAGSETLNPEQAVLRFDSAASPVGTVVFPAILDGTRLTAIVKQSELASKIPDGPVSVALVLGDSSIEQGADIALASQLLLLTSTPNEALLPPQRDSRDIQHTFRQPERRVNPLAPVLGVAGVLTLGALACLAALRTLCSRFSATDVTLTRVTFFSTLTATIGLLVVFWLRLTLVQILPPLAALLALTAVTGRGLTAPKAKSS